MFKKKKKLGRLSINGQEVDSDKFMQDVKDKYGIDEKLFEYIDRSVKDMSAEEIEKRAESTLFSCERNCGVGLVVDLTGSGKCPRCGGQLQRLAIKK
jgi:hypothetical protein